MIMEQRIRNVLGLVLVLCSAECSSVVLFDAAPQASSAFIDYSSIEPKVLSSSSLREDPSSEITSDVSGDDEALEGANDFLGLLGPPISPTKPNVVRRNYLRFGKKRSQPKNPSGLERRDYREFVRFGKRAQGHVKNKSFLRFGRALPPVFPNTEDPLDEIWSRLSQDELKALGKRVNDYLRFG